MVMNPFENLKTIDDFRRADEEFRMRKQESDARVQLLQQKGQQMQKGGNLPAALQLANEYQARVDAGDHNGANLIAQFAKTVDKGLQIGADGQYQQMPGYGAALGQNQYEKTLGGNMADLQTAGALASARNASELEYAPKIAEAREIGAAAGKKTAEIKTKGTNAVNNLMLIDEAEKLLPNATSGLGQKLLGGLVNAAGVSTDKTKADRQLNILAAGLTAGVPKMSGPQSDKDVALYKQAAGDFANPLVPFQDRQAAAATMKMLEKKYQQAASPITNNIPNESFSEMPLDEIPADIQEQMGNIRVSPQPVENRPNMNISPQDPRIAAARAAGYSDQEITNYLGGR